MGILGVDILFEESQLPVLIHDAVAEINIRVVPRALAVHELADQPDGAAARALLEAEVPARPRVVPLAGLEPAVDVAVVLVQADL